MELGRHYLIDTELTVQEIALFTRLRHQLPLAEPLNDSMA